MTTTPLPTTKPSDEHASSNPLFFGLAIPYMLGALMICGGLIVGGTFGLIVAFGSFLLLLAGVVVGLWAWLKTDDED